MLIWSQITELCLSQLSTADGWDAQIYCLQMKSEDGSYSYM